MRGANANPVVSERLVQVAKKKKIPYQIQAEPGGTGTDANAIQLSRAGVATGLVSVPQRYMHTPVEIASLEDLDHTARLLAEFALAVDEKTSFYTVKITSVDIWTVVVPTIPGRVHSPEWVAETGWDQMPKHIVRLNTDTELVGLGETRARRADRNRCGKGRLSFWARIPSN